MPDEVPNDDIGNEKFSPSPTIQVDESFYVEFAERDGRDPANFSRFRKWVITITACAFTGIVGSASDSYAMGYQSMMQDLNATEFQATVGLSLYALGFGIVPLFTSSFSEEFGRTPLYIVSSFCFMLTEMMIALAPNIQTVLVARALGGAFGSTGATLVGGSVADIWQPYERGLPMSLFALVAVASTGLGPVIAGWIEADSRLGWRWIQWVHVIFTGAYFISVLLFMKETRSSIILSRMARKLRRDTGDERYRAKAEIEKQSLWTMMKISSTRPIWMLITEPTVQSFSVWIGFTWGVVFCLVESISPEFESLYGFDVGETGTIFVTLMLGSFIGFIANTYWQEAMYRKHYARKAQEARLYLPCVAALLLPIGMFIYSWTASPNVHWIAPMVGLTVFMSGAFIIYMVVFLYLADCYGPYASSALAGQSLCRNLSSFTFPLFTDQMFSRLTYKWATTLFALLAVGLVPIPYVLFFFGAKIRQRSVISRKILEAESEAADKVKS
ncbi:MFS general substrate transporter [Leucogyrophana mollusca]|uniref:MFS general substrate transporter n=1 Tax=Leucogyrophana mollusca TaxID=85980 RepID=A0ACB8BEA5_9AGAM|nr:MFS general substrate transporter [Leucogyrophana mollusca]